MKPYAIIFFLVTWTELSYSTCVSDFIPIYDRQVTINEKGCEKKALLKRDSDYDDYALFKTGSVNKTLEVGIFISVKRNEVTIPQLGILKKSDKQIYCWSLDENKHIKNRGFDFRKADVELKFIQRERMCLLTVCASRNIGGQVLMDDKFTLKYPCRKYSS